MIVWGEGFIQHSIDSTMLFEDLLCTFPPLVFMIFIFKVFSPLPFSKKRMNRLCSMEMSFRLHFLMYSLVIGILIMQVSMPKKICFLTAFHLVSFLEL